MRTTTWFLLCLISLVVGAAVGKAESHKTMEEQQPDLSGYFFNYTTCKTIDMTQTDEATRKQLGLDATNGDVRHVVTFRLCPNEAKNNECNENYGEYMIGLEAYLEEVIPFHKQKQLEFCSNSSNYHGEDGYECRSPPSDDKYWINVGFNSSIFPQCQLINENGKNADPSYTPPQSAGVACNDYGHQERNGFQINAYSDKECKVDGGLWECDFMDYDNPFYELIYERINGNHLISCSDANEGTNHNHMHALAGGTEVCQKLYKRAEAKCESLHDFTGVASSAGTAEDEKEMKVCSAIESVPLMKSPTAAPVSLPRRAPTPSPTPWTVAPTPMVLYKSKSGEHTANTTTMMSPSAPNVGKMFLVLGTIAALAMYLITFRRRHKGEEETGTYEKVLQMNNL